MNTKTRNRIDDLESGGFYNQRLNDLRPANRRELAAHLYQAAGELSAYIPNHDGEVDEQIRPGEQMLWEAADHAATTLLDILAALVDVTEDDVE